MSPFFRNPTFDFELICDTSSDPLTTTFATQTFSTTMYPTTMFPQQQFYQQPQQFTFPGFSNNNFNNNNTQNMSSPTPTFTDLKLALQVAASNGDSSRVEELARHGGINLINSQDEAGVTALHSAAKFGRHNVILSLLRLGANPNILTLDGESALHLAVASSDEQSVQQLLSCGAFVNIQDDAGDCPLHWAVRESNIRILDVLLNNGAQVNATNEDGETPLHIAASLGEKKLARALVSRGAQVDVQDGTGVTPLEEAYANEHFDLVKELTALLPNNASRASQNCASTVLDKSVPVEAFRTFHRSSVVAAGF